MALFFSFSEKVSNHESVREGSATSCTNGTGLFLDTLRLGVDQPPGFPY